MLSNSLDFEFQRETVVNVSAAVVGISRLRWCSLSAEDANEERARAVMNDRKFDVLPIDDGQNVTECFATRTWNDYGTIERREILHSDVMHYRTPIKEIIRGFQRDSRSFYFLEEERNIVGLISVANLNCRQVRIYLYSLVCELEVALSRLIDNELTEDQLLDFVRGKDSKDKAILERFLTDRDCGIDVPLVEYLYLSDLVSILGKFRLHKKFASSNRVLRDLGSLAQFRNKIAHPTTSILVGKHPAEELWKQIDRLSGLLFKL